MIGGCSGRKWMDIGQQIKSQVGRGFLRSASDDKRRLVKRSVAAESGSCYQNKVMDVSGLLADSRSP
jgi:hypothetical protein